MYNNFNILYTFWLPVGGKSLKPANNCCDLSNKYWNSIFKKKILLFN